MKLHMLGVNGPFPASGGATSGYLLEAEGRVLGFDFGSGVLSRLTAVYPPEELDALFLSHWHFDHTCDLLPLIYRLESAGKHLTVYGPEDSASAIRKIVSQASCFTLEEVRPGDVISFAAPAPEGEKAAAASPVTVRVGPARHPVPGVGFLVRAEGRSFGYTGDTNTLPELKDFYRGCDLLLADGLFPGEDWGEQKPHLSAALAAELARDAGARRLVLTHLNPVYDPARLLAEARPLFRETALAEAGRVLTL